MVGGKRSRDPPMDVLNVRHRRDHVVVTCIWCGTPVREYKDPGSPAFFFFSVPENSLFIFFCEETFQPATG